MGDIRPVSAPMRSGKSQAMMVHLQTSEIYNDKIVENMVVSLMQLASMQQGKGDVEQADAMYLEAFSLLDKLEDIEAHMVSKLALGLQSMGRIKVSRLSSWSLRLEILLLGVPLEEEDLSVEIFVLAQEAEGLFLRALDTQIRDLGPNHPDVATTMSSMAALLANVEGRADEAEELYNKALKIQVRHNRVVSAKSLQCIT